MQTINFEIDNNIAVLTIDLKDRSMNVLTPEFMQDLDTSVDRVVSDDNILGAVLTSGKSSFIAGADLTELVEAFDKQLSAAEMYKYAQSFQGIQRKLETCGKPFVAAVNGTALGGGLEVALSCHYRVAADNPKAKLGLPEVTVGLLPGGGGTQRLPRLIGMEPALQLILKGSHISPRDALEKGIVNEVVTPDKLLDAAKAALKDGKVDPVQPWDKKGFKVPGGSGLMHPKSIQTLMFGTAITSRETNRNYPAPIAILSCVYEGTVVPIDQGLAIESKYFTTLLLEPTSRNMIRTLFINKGAADKLVRRPQGIDKTKVTKLGVLGAGMMGAGIAYVSARAGMQVMLLDTTKEKAEFGKDYSRKLCEKGVKRGKILSSQADGLLERITTTDDYADLEGCELVIEAVFEDVKIKADVTAKTEAVIPDDAIFASNTSTLPISELAKASQRPAQFIGIHFFSPVDKMPLVEVILGEGTEDRATAVSLDYIQQIRKTPIVVTDSRGFFTSRVFGKFTGEGMAMLAEGVKPALIENGARLAGMPVGPLAVSDEVTLELAYHVMKQTRLALGDDYQAMPADAVVTKFVEELDRRGKRFGKGFYDYPEDAPKHLWPGLSEVYPVASTQPTAAQVKQRLLHVQAVDTVRCLEEGVLLDPADGDIGSIFGIGFPPYTGGAISYIETIGLAQFVQECDELAEQHGARFEVPPGLRTLAEQGGSYFASGKDSSKRSAA